MTQWRVWLEHRRGADLHIVKAATKEEACRIALANAAAPDARVTDVHGGGEL